MGVPATPVRRIEIVPYSDTWPALFARLGANLRTAVGDVALRIDHIGSTSVPQLAAKPIVDVQISVVDLEPLDAFGKPLCRLGFVYRADNPERTKRYFREAPGHRRTHIHVRRAGSFSEQFPLLFRDYLRAHPDEASAYAKLKRQTAACFPENRGAYTEAKEPFIWDTMRQADAWAQRTGWQPGPSDA